jgi:hypothetical protein
MHALATTAKTVDWPWVGQRANHSAAITEHNVDTAIAVMVKASPPGPEALDNISSGTAPIKMTMTAIM